MRKGSRFISWNTRFKKKIIKTPKNPNQTFLDDPLRIFRAARFATQLNFKLKKNILKSIKINNKRIKIISQQRIIKEINKIILSKKTIYRFLYIIKRQNIEVCFTRIRIFKYSK